MRIGKFDSNYASGALNLKLEQIEPYKIFVTAKCQSGYSEVLGNRVASEATIYLITAPLMLKFFVEELEELIDQKRDRVYLQAV